MLKQDLKEEAIQLSNNGISYGKIAEQLGVGKTTVYNWINSTTEINEEKTVPERQTNVPNSFKNDLNELGDYKEELQNEYEIENDVSSLVALKKAEMDHELKMERIELERERMLFEQKQVEELKKTEQLTLQLEEFKLKIEHERQKTEQLSLTINKLEQNNNLLLFQLDRMKPKKKIEELDDKLKTNCLEQVNNYLALEGAEITLEEVLESLDGINEIIDQFKQWIKNTNGRKPDYPQLIALNKIRKSLSEMIEVFESCGENELVFDFDNAFVQQLNQEFNF